jgi:hypothetical protein
VALNKFAEAHEKAFSRMLGISSAYTDYLRSIGMDKQADAYQRNVMSSQAAQQANYYFGKGDLESGYKSAAQAENLARSGKTGGGLFGDTTAYSGRALTGAVPNMGGRVTVQMNNNFSAGPDYQKRESKRIQGDMNNTQYYSSFTW